jgi:hypothetical protein
MKLDNLENEEVKQLIKKYSCEKDMQIVLDGLCKSGRINKTKIRNTGLNDKNINAAITRLRLCLKDYED